MTTDQDKAETGELFTRAADGIRSAAESLNSIADRLDDPELHKNFSDLADKAKAFGEDIFSTLRTAAGKIDDEDADVATEPTSR